MPLRRLFTLDYLIGKILIIKIITYVICQFGDFCEEVHSDLLKGYEKMSQNVSENPNAKKTWVQAVNEFLISSTRLIPSWYVTKSYLVILTYQNQIVPKNSCIEMSK